MSKIVCRFAVAYLQGRVKIPIGGKVREPKGQLACIAAQRLQGTSRWNYGTDSDPAGVVVKVRFRSCSQGYLPELRLKQKPHRQFA